MFQVTQIIQPNNNPDANPVEIQVSTFKEFWQASSCHDSLRNQGVTSFIYSDHDTQDIGSWKRMTDAQISMACFYDED